jgi:putative ABC transport system substrate-binding protein
MPPQAEERPMRRRKFIIALGGAALWPLPALGQRAASRSVGVLHVGTLEEARTNFGAIRRRLAEMGYVEGRNLAVEYRWADSQEDRLTALAGDLVQQQVDAIVVFTGPSVVAAKAATRSVPIIFFTGFDPVANGFVASINRPGGNATGIAALNTQLLAKRLEVLCELVPTAKLVGFLYSATNLVSGYDLGPKALESAADALGVKLLFVEAKGTDFDGAFERIANAQSDALLLSADGPIFRNRERLVGLATRYRIPAGYPIREFAVAGGLVSYGTNYPEAYRQLGDYLGRVLNGEKPEDLPVQQATKLELVINIKTAKTLGIEIPPILLARADELIE